MKVQILDEAFTYDNFSSIARRKRITRGSAVDVVAVNRKDPAFRNKRLYSVEFVHKASREPLGIIEIGSNAEHVSLIVPIYRSATYSLTAFEWDDTSEEEIIDVFNKSVSASLKSIDLDTEDPYEFEDSLRDLFSSLASRFKMKLTRAINY